MPNCAKKGRDNLQSNLNRKNMEVIEFLKNFADQFDDTDASEIKTDTNFRELEEWSSIVSLAVLNMIEKKYNVTIIFSELRGINTVQELFDLVQKKS
jgi:acyl carrier protein